jgi:hypothetical protein
LNKGNSKQPAGGLQEKSLDFVERALALWFPTETAFFRRIFSRTDIRGRPAFLARSGILHTHTEIVVSECGDDL